MSLPNILFALADDWSWPHAAAYGDRIVRLPAFERLASEGVLFTHTFCCVPSCTPSRAGILTGQMPHRLEESANLQSILRPKYKTFSDILEEAGYYVGRVGKGCAPGNVEYSGRKRDPAGPHLTISSSS